MERAIGIDLGTTFSAVAVVMPEGRVEVLPNREGERITPSVVMFDDSDTPIVGTMAKRSAATNPLNVVQFVKRQMGNPAWKFRAETGEAYTPEEISAIILRRLKEDAEVSLGASVRDAVITVPAYFDDAQRKATLDAGHIAGLNVLRIINEPTAAALAYAFESFQKSRSGRSLEDVVFLCENQTVLVYDLGGGTFDVTIMRLGPGGIDVVATGGDKNLGGFDWDNEVMKFLNDEFRKHGNTDLFNDPELEQELRDKAEIAKKTLSLTDKATVLLAAQGKAIPIVLARETFESITAPLLKRTSSIMQFVLEDSGLRWNEIDKVLLTGGSTRMRAVPTLIEKMTAKRPSSELHPDEVVALGAAIQGALLQVREKKPESFPLVRVQDINSHSMGVIALDENERDCNSIVLKKGTPLLCKASDIFHTVMDGQQTIHVQVTEGEDSDPAYVKIVGEGRMSLPPYPKGAGIQLSFEYDHDGIIHVKAFDMTGGQLLGELHIERKSNLTDAEVQAKAQKLTFREVN